MMPALYPDMHAGWSGISGLQAVVLSRYRALVHRRGAGAEQIQGNIGQQIFLAGTLVLKAVSKRLAASRMATSARLGLMTAPHTLGGAAAACTPRPRPRPPPTRLPP